ncbi:MAG: hypothetical protein NUV59_00865 [Patescibacteria group bacterium]|nr:hypothetical protein [Patescibacteria group bacterium]
MSFEQNRFPQPARGPEDEGGAERIRIPDNASIGEGDKRVRALKFLEEKAGCETWGDARQLTAEKLRALGAGRTTLEQIREAFENAGEPLRESDD